MNNNNNNANDNSNNTGDYECHWGCEHHEASYYGHHRNDNQPGPTTNTTPSSVGSTGPTTNTTHSSVGSTGPTTNTTTTRQPPK